MTLRPYMVEALGIPSLFEILPPSGPEGDSVIPRDPNLSFASQFPSKYAITGGLIGDSRLTDDSFDLNLNLGSVQLFATGDRSQILQRFHIELYEIELNKDRETVEPKMVKFTVWDPFEKRWVERQGQFSVLVAFPDVSAGIAGSYDLDNSTGVAGGLNSRASLGRDESLTLAFGYLAFELIRYMSDTYEESENCITDEARKVITFPKKIYGYPDPNFAARKGVPENKSSVSDLSAPVPESEALGIAGPDPVALTEAPSSAPELATLYLADVPRRKVSNVGFEQASLPREKLTRAWKVFEQGLSEQFASKAASDRMALFNALQGLLEEKQPIGDSITIDVAGVKYHMRLSGPITQNRQGRPAYCRKFRISIDSSFTEGMACRSKDAPLWTPI
ncbi:MAG: hypothetical protein AAF530_25170 [Pseudomonadota bacterium]